MPVADELHTPPAVVLLKSVVRPVHTVAVPVIAAAAGLTDTILVAMQLVPIE